MCGFSWGSEGDGLHADLNQKTGCEVTTPASTFGSGSTLLTLLGRRALR